MLLSWGRKPLAVDLSGWDVDRLVPPGRVPVLDDPREAALDALDSPEGLTSFDAWIDGADRVAVVLPDAREPLPWPELPHVVLEKVLASGIDPAAVTLVIATQDRAFSGWKGNPLAGLRDVEGVRVIVHDATGDLVPVGEVGRSGARSVAEGLLGEVVRIAGGQPPSAGRARASASAGGRRTLLLNREVARADRVITISDVVPHPLCGYTGGGQLLLPGVAGVDDIHANEELGLLPTCGAGRVEGNPAREEMDEAAKLLGEGVLSIDAVPGPGPGVVGFASGSPWLVSCVTSPLARETFGAECRPAASVVSSAPCDSLESLLVDAAVSAPAVQTSGTMLVTGECRSGAGDPSRVGRLYDTILAPRLAGAAVLVHTPLEARQVLRCGLRPVRSMASGLEIMKERAGGDERIVVIPEAGRTLPGV